MKPRLTASFLLIFCLQIVSVLALAGCGQRGPLRLPALPPDTTAPPTNTDKPARAITPGAADTAPK